MKALLVRKDGPAIRDTLLWFALIFGSGYLTFILWGSWLFIFPYFVYSVLYASTSDSRWHESSHGTAFKTQWMNNVLYEIASFMVFRQSVTWRWSHTRHHSDTIIRGRDPEIAVPRPADIRAIILNLFGLKSSYVELRKILFHSIGKIDPAVATYVPRNEYHKVFLRARIYVAIYLSVIVLSIVLHSILPLMFIGIPTLVGTWLLIVYGLTQHAGLAENVLDHRLNCRTVYMNRLNRFLYWNMGYHLEHHMFPLVPYHALPQLHELIKSDCPLPYSGLISAYKEIIPTLLRQSKDPDYFIKREVPKSVSTYIPRQRFIGDAGRLSNGWIEACPSEALQTGEVIRFDFLDHTYAIYRTSENKYYGTDGICTHGNAHLADGLVIGNIIECARHNGRFSLIDGSVQRQPASVKLRTYKVKSENDIIFINIKRSEEATDDKVYSFKVVSNRNRATFIKELILRPITNDIFIYTPGDYIKLEIPPFESDLKNVDVEEPYRSRWQSEYIYDHFVRNNLKVYRNYSMASNPDSSSLLKFNIRLSLPPEGQNYSAGIGSSYAFNLKEGDIVRLTGPYGTFHIRDSKNEMIYIGGGAGMAPIKSHISYLFDTKKTSRKVSYWYGARSKMELFYTDYFTELEKNNENFKFNMALSDPLPSDNWNSYTGYIHQIVRDNYLHKIPAIENIEFYLCGPPGLIKACLEMLNELNVNSQMISYDEF